MQSFWLTQAHEFAMKPHQYPRIATQYATIANQSVPVGSDPVWWYIAIIQGPARYSVL